MIADFTIGFNEIDLFRIRYHELKDLVDLFVVVEGTHTHRGDLKPTHFANWREYCINNPPEIINEDIDWSKIKILTWDNGADFAPLDKQYSWVRENYQREILGMWAVENLKSDDLCILSDMDEIPSADALRRYLAQGNYTGVVRFEQHLCYLFFNTTAGNWCGSKIFPVSEIVNMPGDRPMTDLVRYRPEHMIAGTIKQGGFHFSSCGGLERVNTKLRSYAHSHELEHITRTVIQDSIDNLTDPFNKNPLTVVDCNFLPRYVLDNLTYFKDNGYIYGAD